MKVQTYTIQYWKLWNGEEQWPNVELSVGSSLRVYNEFWIKQMQSVNEETILDKLKYKDFLYSHIADNSQTLLPGVSFNLHHSLFNSIK